MQVVGAEHRNKMDREGRANHSPFELTIVAFTKGTKLEGLKLLRKLSSQTMMNGQWSVIPRTCSVKLLGAEISRISNMRQELEYFACTARSIHICFPRGCIRNLARHINFRSQGNMLINIFTDSQTAFRQLTNPTLRLFWECREYLMLLVDWQRLALCWTTAHSWIKGNKKMYGCARDWLSIPYIGYEPAIKIIGTKPDQ